jgi:hypothetical protein
MKHVIALFFVGGVATLLSSCAEDNASVTTGLTIAGKWKVAYDSTVYVTGTAPTAYTVHTGQSGDYFYFKSDGHLYVKEGATLDSMTYKINSGNTITITSTVIYDPAYWLNGQMIDTVSVPQGYYVSKLTPHSAVISWPLYGHPGPFETRTISLSR